MPHKANPVLSVLVRRAALAAPAARRDAAPRRRRRRRRARRRCLAHRVGDAARRCSGARSSPAPRPPSCWPGCRSRRPDGGHASPTRATTCAPSSAAWPSSPGTRRPADYLGAARRRSSRRRWPARPAYSPRRPDDRPAITAVRLTAPRSRAELPLLVLGPSLGTSATTLWAGCAAGLTDAFDVVALGPARPRPQPRGPDEPFTMAELAAGVLSVVDDVLAERGEPAARFSYAGDSVGGAVGLQLLLDAPGPGRRPRCCCAPAPGSATAESWAERIGQVRVAGTPVAGHRVRRALVRPGLPRARARARARRCCTRCRRPTTRLRPGVRRARRVRRTRPARPRSTAPVLAVAGRRRPATPPDEAARDRRRRAGRPATSSSTASPTWRPPRRPRRWPG